MTTPKCLLIACCFIYSITSFAQEAPIVHEVGLSLNSGLDFGLVYKTGKPNALFRLQALSLGNSHFYQEKQTRDTYGFGFSMGSEFRKNIIEGFSVIYGFGAGIHYQSYKTQQAFNDDTYGYTIQPRINLLVGANYILKEHLSLSLEVLPYLSYGINYSNNGSIDNFNATISYGFNMSSVQLVVAYRFSKSKKEKE